MVAGVPQPASGPPASAFRAKVRMYRHGLGDCFLVTLPRGGGGSYFILIDCGVIVGTKDAEQKLAAVVADVVKTTGDGGVDLLIATHEHWDHISGFVQASEALKKLKVKQTWLAWTEDPDDELAQKLARERDAAVAGLRAAASRLHLAGDRLRADAVSGVVGLFGVGGQTTRDAMEVVRRIGGTPRYCRPEDPPVPLQDPKARLYVLGPPRDERFIKKTRPSSSAPETYGLVLSAFKAGVEPGLQAKAPEPPFGRLYAVPWEAAEEMPFFKTRYWGGDAWRRIDTSWLTDAADLALQLDNATNNTCLVLAIELADGTVLLFAGDAQVGSWLSWQDLRWSVNGGVVSGPDLLRHTIFYKVGHHGSHNATLKEKGLELMDALQVAAIPVDKNAAMKKGWTRMPLDDLVDALQKKTRQRVLRADAGLPPALAGAVTEDHLYYEVAF